MAGTLTSANSVILLSVPGLFDVPQQLQGFTADDIFDTESVSPSQTVMGVDGHLSGGFVFVEIKQNIRLQADSDSILIFEEWYAAMQKAREIYIANGIISLPAVHRKYACTRGFLTSHAPTAAAGKILKSRSFQITWESVSAAPV